MQLLATRANSFYQPLILGWQAFIQPVLAPFLISRIFILVAALVLQWLLDSDGIYKYGFIGDAPLAPLSATFDANAYGGIATNGYSTSADVTQPQNYHFFPLYPLLMRLAGNLLGLGTVPGGYYLAGVVLSHIFFLVALGLLYRLTLAVWNDTARAHGTVWLMCALPWANVFSMSYTESLFLMLTAAAILLAFKNRVQPFGHSVAWASLFAALATLTRPQGFIVAMTVAWLVSVVPQGMTLYRRVVLVLLSIVPSLVAGAGFVLYIAAHTGSDNLMAIQQTTTAWGDGWLSDLPRVFSLPPTNPMWFLDMQATVTLILWSVLTLLLFSQILKLFRGKSSLFEGSTMSPKASMALALYAAGSLLVTVAGNPMNIGWGRYMLVTFPLVWLLAASLPRGAAFRRVMTVALTTQVIFMFGVVMLQFTP